MVQNDIFRDRSLPAHVKLVYACLCGYADDDRVAYPSQQTIADDTGLSARAVGKAVKQGAAAGLFEVIHTQTSNRYRLHDLGVGGYVIGSGPLATPESPVGTTCHPEPHQAPSGSAPRANELDQRTRPETKTSSTSSDAYAAGAPEQARGERPAPKLYIPRNFDDRDDGDAFRYLVAASLSALKAAGRDPAPDAADRIGLGLRATAETEDRRRIVEMLERTLALAGTDDPTWGSLATIDPWAEAS